ncbi:carboxymethylenebutenolidase [Acidihalobacter yilgarnensis]|uniref:Carboxymethylenebutenolidase n=1 Tax=Acidihalobacter yilgarnensis TaxID=2819280 RepID=A0A1D8IMH4_9GAMM|nr:dienelactone hydrolase family protein [Acidihalobacter yilgarnensis]AOU97672.1 carboxymethylenebutenolidase [Acidihalobacter yilgarnensis]
MSNANTQAEWVDITPELRGYLARPPGEGPYPAVLVFIEAYGVNDHFQSLANRLAEAGYVALVPDIYHGHVYEYSDSDNAIAHLRGLNDEQVMGETDAALDLLVGHPAVAGSKPGVLGFCMGGRYAFLTHGTRADRVGASVAYYGGGIAPTQDRLGRVPLLDRIPSMQAPLLLHYGAADGSIAPDEHARVAEALSHAGKRYGLQVYPEAGHGFFCDQRASYHAGAADESWRLTLDFFASHIKE